MRYGLCLLLVSLTISELRIEARASPRPQETPAEESSSARETPPPPEQGEPRILGAPPAFDLSHRAEETLWVEADTGLHRQPAARSPTVARLTGAAELPVLERRGGWARVRYGSWQGWVPLDPDEAGAEDLEVPPTAWWTPRPAPHAALLELARSFLGAERRTTLGPYQLYTDIENDQLLARLARVADQLPAVFEERFGAAVRPGEQETLVLYARDESYRAYAEAQGDPSALDSLGHAIGGLAVLAVGERRREEVRSLLVHELTHVLTYRALGPDLPVWLVEGMAEDLAFCRVSPRGEILTATLDGWRSASTLPYYDPRGGRTRFTILTTRGGPEASLERLRQQWRSPLRTPITVLLDLPRLDFMDADSRQLHYAMSAFLVRFLMAQEAYRAPFREFLEALADGERGGGADLLARLATTWRDLESQLADWLFSNAPLRPPKKPGDARR